MTDNDFSGSNLPTVPRGGKRGWVKVTTELPPERFEDLERVRGKVTRSEYLFRLIDPNLPRAA